LAESWFDVLKALVRRSTQPGAGGHTPSDFPLAHLTQSEVDRLELECPRLEDILPLSPVQEGLMFHALYDNRARDVYCAQLVLGLDGQLDAPMLQDAANALLRRHSALRAGFHNEGLGRPVQVILPEVPLPWRTVDLSTLDGPAREEHLANFLAHDRAQRFELSCAPLLRFTLIRLALDRHQLVFTHHHIVMDGWSLPVLVKELLTLYVQRGDSGILPQVTPYGRYLAWIATQDPVKAQAAWQSELAGLEEPTLLAPVQPGRALTMPERITCELTEGLTQALTRQARAHGLTLNTILQGAWAILLGRLTGRSDVVFGTTVAGRPSQITGVETMVGLFINTLPVRVRLRPKQPLSELLTRLQDSQSKLIAHQHLGLVELQRLTGLGALFDTLVVFENYPVDRNLLAQLTSGLRLSSAEAHGTTHYPLTITALPGQRLHLRFAYRPDLFERCTVEGIARRLEHLLEGIVADPGQPIGRLEVLTPEERKQILVEWNETSRALSSTTLPAFFEAQTRSNPEATALVCEEGMFTYAELNAQANRLAHLLTAKGIGPEAIVAVALPRSPEMITSLLAILKAGAAYLPLDPDYPAERLAFMLRDAEPACVLTTAQVAARLPDKPPRLFLEDPNTLSALSRSLDIDPTDEQRTHPLVPQHPAYVIYTSGSTGRPRGVIIEHRNFASYLC
jgi:hypothetical protein